MSEMYDAVIEVCESLKELNEVLGVSLEIMNRRLAAIEATLQTLAEERANAMR